MVGLKMVAGDAVIIMHGNLQIALVKMPAQKRCGGAPVGNYYSGIMCGDMRGDICGKLLPTAKPPQRVRLWCKGPHTASNCDKQNYQA